MYEMSENKCDTLSAWRALRKKESKLLDDTSLKSLTLKGEN